MVCREICDTALAARRNFLSIYRESRPTGADSMPGNATPVYPHYEMPSHTLSVVLLLFICFWSFFYNIGVMEVDLMEARNLVTAREILDNDNWLIPTMNGEIRLAKPPLPTWFAALASLSDGRSDNLAWLRIPNAISSTLLILFCYGLCWTMSRDRTQAFMAAAILATNFLVMGVGHRATWDIFCHSFMLGALWAFMDGMRNDRGWPVFAIFGTLMGLSFMSKGPVSFFAMLLPFILSYLWVFKTADFRAKWPLILFAFAICIFISGLWPFYIWKFHPEAMLTTFSVETDAWINRHLRPFWYYLRFPLYSGLWLFIGFAALAVPFARKRVKSVEDYRFLLYWLAFSVLLLSVIPEKKLRYLLPAIIPLAMLSGTVLRGILDSYRQGTVQKGDAIVTLLHASLIAIVALLYPGLFFYNQYFTVGNENLWLYLFVFTFSIAVAVSCWFCFKSRNLFGLFALTVVQFCFITILYMGYYDDLSYSNPDYKIMKEVDPAVLAPAETIFRMRDGLSIRYVWDLNRKVKEWNVETAKALLENGKTIAVIAAGDPNEALHQALEGDLDIQLIDNFDYDEDRAHRVKTTLSLVSLRK
jgi:4-amino-4-deoxy-L-arabinose transferase-like glycosyltransferase